MATWMVVWGKSGDGYPGLDVDIFKWCFVCPLGGSVLCGGVQLST